ncbi:MAG TPA: OsmC family protein [Allosphingosinicella sp.]|uniref:OsmC family protein n=1 Tax=Allosphingosinicella sp. TaxID=2823234 RepID=UPI002EDB26F6
MGTHMATVSWSSDGEFLSGKYSRAHEWLFDGGAVVRGSSSPSVVPLPMSDATAVDPEEALIASASSCHMLWFLSLAQRAGLDVASYRDEASGVMGKDARSRIAITRITLRPVIAFKGHQPDAAELQRLHHEAHEKCFIANSLLSEIVVEPA